MSDFSKQKSTHLYSPPQTKPKRNSSFKDLITRSYNQKPKTNEKKCALCLTYSFDCSNFRCKNKTHFVCQECACDWEYDKKCPVCRNSSRGSSPTGSELLGLSSKSKIR